MRLFERKGKELPGGKDKGAKLISDQIIKIQKGFAVLMSKITKDMSVTSMKWALGFFILSGSVLSLCCVSAVFSSKVIKVESIKVPKYYDQPDGKVEQGKGMGMDEWESIAGFKNYMDSLREFNLGIYDSILLKRPGLIDSMNEIYRIYQKQ